MKFRSKEFFGTCIILLVLVAGLLLSLGKDSCFASPSVSKNVKSKDDKDGLVLLDKVTATVNGDAIFYSHIQSKLATSNIVLFSSYPSSEDDSDFNKALNDEINIKLAVAASKGLGLDKQIDVDKQISDFLKSKNLSKKELVSELESQGISYAQYRQDFEDQMLIKNFQAHIIYPMIKITDKDLESYYLTKNSKKARSNLKYDIRILLVKQSDQADKKVQAVYSELESGRKFADAVNLYSDDSSTRKEGGLVSGVSLKDLAPNIAKVVKELKPSSYSRPIKVQEGYYIVYLESSTLASNSDFKASKAQLQASYSQELYDRYLTSWLESQRRKAQIVINK